MSAQAQALIDDVRSRREQTSQVATQSPFPDLDRMLSFLQSGQDNFTFSLDPKFASSDTSPAIPKATTSTFRGSFDPFSSTSTITAPRVSNLPPPPGISPRGTRDNLSAAFYGTSTDRSPMQVSDQRGNTSNGRFSADYNGSFNPFADTALDFAKPGTPSQSFLDDESRRGSRFGFARKKGSTASSIFGNSAAPSPATTTDALPQTPLYASSDVVSPAPSSSSHQLPQWTYQNQADYGAPPGIPSIQHMSQLSRGEHAGNFLNHEQFSYQQMDGASLKEMLNIGRNMQERRSGIVISTLRSFLSSHAGCFVPEPTQQSYASQFGDPAIMSLRMGNQVDHSYNGPPGIMNGHHPHVLQSHAPPPGLLPNGPLPPPPGLQRLFNETKPMNAYMGYQQEMVSPPGVTQGKSYYFTSRNT